MFKVEDIKAGYLLEMEDGDLCTVQYNDRDELAISSEMHWFHLDLFGKNLTYASNKIMKIYGRTNNLGLCRREIVDRKLLWERKEMTISEAEEKFGITIIN